MIDIQSSVVFLLIFLISVSTVGALMCRHMLKLSVFLSFLSDCILIFLLIAKVNADVDLQENIPVSLEPFVISFIAVKFALSMLIMLSMKTHSEENPPLDKDYRPKHYD